MKKIHKALLARFAKKGRKAGHRKSGHRKSHRKV
jgi:hypothetical protein